MERSLLLSAVETALSLSPQNDADGSIRRFAIQASQEWLASWPGDFRVRRLLANALAASGDLVNALHHMQQACEANPEDVETYNALIPLLQQNNLPQLAAEADACQFALDPTLGMRSSPPEWSDMLQSAMGMARAGRWQESRWAAESVLSAQPSFALTGLVHLKAILQLADFPTALVVSGEYRKRWPACIAFSLLAAQSCFSMNRSTQGVEYLQGCSILDPAGEVADRYLGALNPYKPLWPARLEAEIRTAIPQAVVVAAGWNRLGSATEPMTASSPLTPSDFPVLAFPNFDINDPTSHATPDLPPTPIPGEKYPGPSSEDEMSEKRGRKPVMPSTVVEMPKEPVLESDPGLDDLRVRLQSLSKKARHLKTQRAKDAGRPAYIVLTSLKKLSAWYRQPALPAVEKSLEAILAQKKARPGWSAYLVDVDNPGNLAPFGLQAVDAGNAWQIKTLLSELDSALQKKGEMIGALMIVGGHEIIPFHLLPNPAADDDADVPSDNPYAVRDENYFVPEWPVGRIPTPQQAGPSFLLTVLGHIGSASKSVRQDIFSDWLAFFQTIFQPMALRYRAGSGYSAEIWKRASAEVFRGIGPSSALLSSPPTTSGTIPLESIGNPTYAYFNLHGMSTGPEWLGQRAPSSSAGSIEFPIAITPDQVGQNGKSPKTVFSEACYGSHIVGKEPNTALSLKFLEAGVGAMAGSTRIAYGAANAPLIAADLLAHHYLANCQSGMACGEAMRQAKLSFASEMNKLQGYLDPEDQKSLISFVLYGDPLFATSPQQQKYIRKGFSRATKRSMDIPLFSVGAMDSDSSGPSETVQKNLKEALHRYLPGITDSALTYWRPRVNGETDAQTHDPQKNKKAPPLRAPAWVVAMEKTYTMQGQTVTHFVRMSVDSRGKVMKIAVSR
jgi:hypothetical protein